MRLVRTLILYHRDRSRTRRPDRVPASARRAPDRHRDRSLLARYLAEKFAGDNRLQLVEADALRTDLSQWGPAAITGNLPYYVATPILEHVLQLGSSLRRAVFLLQKEVAERTAAAPGSRAYGYLSVATQLFADVELLFEVKPAAFHPPPKVDSAVIRRLRTIGPPNWASPLPALFSVLWRSVFTKNARRFAKLGPVRQGVAGRLAASRAARRTNCPDSSPSCIAVFRLS